MRIQIVLLMLVVAVLGNANNNNITIIPKPDLVIEKPGFFELSAQTVLYSPKNTNYDISKLNDYFISMVESPIGLKLKKTNKRVKRNYISFIIEPKLGIEDYYEISVTKERILIRAKNEKGVFLGIQSLRQLLPAEVERKQVVSPLNLKIPCVEITDYSRFKYRGLLIDVGRHFYSKEEIKKIIDIMALYKLNTLHWHLTEDQGWRIEIKKYPLLTEIGSWRRETVIDKITPKTSPKERVFDGKPHFGYYTQDDIREVVEYASTRYITIIPEINMPGHATAALAAYPELGCSGGPYDVATMWGVFNDVFCSKKETITFLKDVLTEVIELFPGKYIHIGGDECPKVRWKNCIHCQTIIKENNLKDENTLQTFFMSEIESFLNSKGRSIIGWDEILEGGLMPNATVMSWRSEKGGFEAAKEGHDAIMTPRHFCYFDYYQSKDQSEPFAIGGYVPVSKVYEYNPVPQNTPDSISKHIIGVQANLWTEHINNVEYLQYMLLPRLLAMSEVQWTQQNKRNYSDFLKRIQSHRLRLDYMGFNYAKHIFE